MNNRKSRERSNDVRVVANPKNRTIAVQTEKGIKHFSYADLVDCNSLELGVKKSDPVKYRNFVQFHKDNPFVYDRIKELALKYKKDYGVERESIRHFFHLIRGEILVKCKDEKSNFKINDHYSPYYSRLIMIDCPELSGFFETRGWKKPTGENHDK
jgi:hypothetical protein